MAKDKAKLLSDEAYYSNDYLNYRNNRVIQDYYLHGGDLKHQHADMIRNTLMRDMKTRSALLDSQLDMSKARYTTYDKYGDKLLKAQLQQLDDKNWLFKNIEKPYQEKFGNTFRVLDGAVGVLGKALSSFLRLPFFK